MNKEETKEYMRLYYIHNKAAYQKRYRDWCEDNPNVSRAKRGKEKRTPEEIEAYRRQYYRDHKDVYRQKYREWVERYPGAREAANQRWRAKNPTYYRDYMRKRVATVDPLIFEFLDGGFDNDIGDFINHLRVQGTPAQHIGWFKKDIQKYFDNVKPTPIPFSERYM